MVMSRQTYRRSSNPFRARREFSLMRTIGRVVIIVIVVAAIYIVIDFSGRIWAESYVGGEVEKALGLDGKPDVTFGGSLFLPQLVSGELSSARAEMEDFTSNGVGFTAATLKLENVQFSPAKLLFHKDSTIVAQNGSGTATMTSQQLTDAFRNAGIPVNLQFDANGADACQYRRLLAVRDRCRRLVRPRSVGAGRASHDGVCRGVAHENVRQRRGWRDQENQRDALECGSLRARCHVGGGAGRPAFAKGFDRADRQSVSGGRGDP